MKYQAGKRKELLLPELHDLNLAASYSDKIIMLKNGDLLMYDTTDKIFTKENIKEVFEVESEITKSKISNEISIKILPS